MKFFPKLTFSPSNYFIWLNTFLLLGLLFFGEISPLAIVLGYVFETIIIGVFNVLKMFTALLASKKMEVQEKWGQFFMIPFFICHYGFFIFIQSTFVFLFFSINTSYFTGSSVFQNFKNALAIDGMPEVLLIFFIMNLAYFVYWLLKAEKRKDETVATLLFQPYYRIFIQQFVVILAGFFMILGNAGFVAALLLIIFRFLVDMRLVDINIDSNGIYKKMKEAEK